MMKKGLLFFGVILLLMLPMLSLFNSGLPNTHDGPDHVIRGANYFINLSEGNIIPRWAPNVNYGFGHPVLMFFYPLAYYSIALFHLLGFSFIDSTKLVFGVSYVASGFAMYLWVSKFTGKTEGVLAGLLYMIAPYRFVDLYVRGAIGEHMAFVFPPLICYFLLLLSQKYAYRYIVGGVLAVALLILSHNAISIMFLPIGALYGVYLVWLAKDKRALIKLYLLILVLGFSLSAFFWIPAFFESKYTLVNIVTGGREFASSFVDIGDLLSSPWSYGGTGEMSVQIGIVHWISVIGALLSLFFLQKKNKPLKIFTTGILVIFLGTIFVMTQASAFIWDATSLLPKFQFPWRFLAITVFASSVLGGIFLFSIKQKWKRMLFVFLIILLLFVNKDFWHAKGYVNKDDMFFSSVTRTTTNDTGESSPIWSIRFMENPPLAHMEVIDGEADIKENKRSATYHAYTVAASEAVRIRENTLYFPGWEVLVDGKKTDIEFQDPANRGIMTFFIDKGIHAVEVKFGETKLRTFANSITVIGMLLLMGVLLWRRS